MKQENYFGLEDDLKKDEIKNNDLKSKLKYCLYHLGKSKTVFCRHEGSCLSNCMIGGFKSFYLGFLIRLLINFLVLVFFQKKQRKR